MNRDRIEGNWKQAKGRIKEQWGMLTDDHLEVIAGRRDRLLGKIQETYGIASEDAERQVREWESLEKQETREQRTGYTVDETTRRIARAHAWLIGQ